MAPEVLWNGICMENPEGQLRLGTDSFALADFVRPKPQSRVCDLGCGNGAVSLMLLASDPSLFLTGIEIQSPAADAARRSAAASHLEDRFTVIRGDLREIRTFLPAASFDAVVANPPYYKVGSGPAPKSDAMAAAKTELFCRPDDLCAAAAWLLPAGGSFALVHRPERLADLMAALRAYSFAPKRLRFCRHRAESDASLLLLESIKGGRGGLVCEPDLILTDGDGAETAASRRIYHR